MFTPDTRRFPVRFDIEPDGEYQKRMRARFVSHAEKVLEAWGPSSPDVFQVGLETEYSVVTSNLNPVEQKIRDEATKDPNLKDFVTPELGSSQIEIATKPIDLRKHSGLKVLKELQSCERKLQQFLNIHGAHLLRVGTNPLISPSDMRRTDNKEKYQRCPDFHNQHQRLGMERYIGRSVPIDVGNAMGPSVTNSVQVNMDCHTIEEGIDFLNGSLAVAPIVTALGSNAGFLNVQDSGYADVRYMTWAISHDIRTWEEVFVGTDVRVGLPSRYYLDMNDYLSSVLSHPFFMESNDEEIAFNMGVGTYWRDARLKFIEKEDKSIQLVVEFRPLSTQPSAQEDFALIMFYVGLVLYGQQRRERLLPMIYVRANKELAMRFGLAANFWVVDEARMSGVNVVRGFDLIPGEICRSILGLESMGLDKPSLKVIHELLTERLKIGTPMHRFRGAVYQEMELGATMRQALSEAIYNGKLIL